MDPMLKFSHDNRDAMNIMVRIRVQWTVEYLRAKLSSFVSLFLFHYYHYYYCIVPSSYAVVGIRN